MGSNGRDSLCPLKKGGTRLLHPSLSSWRCPVSGRAGWSVPQTVLTTIQVTSSPVCPSYRQSPHVSSGLQTLNETEAQITQASTRLRESTCPAPRPGRVWMAAGCPAGAGSSAQHSPRHTAWNIHRCGGAKHALPQRWTHLIPALLWPEWLLLSPSPAPGTL